MIEKYFILLCFDKLVSYFRDKKFQNVVVLFQIKKKQTNNVGIEFIFTYYVIILRLKSNELFNN